MHVCWSSLVCPIFLEALLPDAIVRGYSLPTGRPWTRIKGSEAVSTEIEDQRFPCLVDNQPATRPTTLPLFGDLGKRARGTRARGVEESRPSGPKYSSSLASLAFPSVVNMPDYNGKRTCSVNSPQLPTGALHIAALG